MKQSVSDIKNILDGLTIEELNKALLNYKEDDRLGVKKLIEGYEKKINNYYEELDRLFQMNAYERKYEHMEFIAGVDEVGRGPLCGPVVTAAVILPKDVQILYVNDSKKLSEQKRNVLFEEINSKALAVSIGMVHPDIIDEINILNATKMAMKEAILGLKIKPDIVLIDALTLPDLDIPQEGIIKGDAKSISIAAASIIAKVTRDRMMEGYAELYPEYNLSGNKGYGTAEHINALKLYGPSPIHRESFIKNLA